MLNALQMFSGQMMQVVRGLKTHAVLRDAKSTTTSSFTASTSGGPDDHKCIPSNWDKRILVWTKKYPNKESIPKRVPIDTMQAAMSRFRIRVANFMMIFTLSGCLYVVLSGKHEVNKKLKDASTEHEDMRRQVVAEYKASLQSEKK